VAYGVTARETSAIRIVDGDAVSYPRTKPGILLRMGAGSIRWGRIVLGGFLAELILVVFVIPIRALGGPEAALTVVAVAGSFFVFVPVAWWLTRSIANPVLHGALMGATAVAIYLVLGLVGKYFAPNAPPAPFIYYVAHALKIAGGAAGGWFATRRVIA